MRGGKGGEWGGEGEGGWRWGVGFGVTVMDRWGEGGKIETGDVYD